MNKAFLEITMNVAAKDRPKAGAVYAKYKDPFLATIPGAESKELLLREEGSGLYLRAAALWSASGLPPLSVSSHEAAPLHVTESGGRATALQSAAARSLNCLKLRASVSEPAL